MIARERKLTSAAPARVCLRRISSTPALFSLVASPTQSSTRQPCPSPIPWQWRHNRTAKEDSCPHALSRNPKTLLFTRRISRYLAQNCCQPKKLSRNLILCKSGRKCKRRTMLCGDNTRKCTVAVHDDYSSQFTVYSFKLPLYISIVWLRFVNLLLNSWLIDWLTISANQWSFWWHWNVVHPPSHHLPCVIVTL